MRALPVRTKNEPSRSQHRIWPGRLRQLDPCGMPLRASGSIREIPESADQSKIAAEYTDGILKLNVTKKEEAKFQTREIAVK